MISLSSIVKRIYVNIKNTFYIVTVTTVIMFALFIMMKMSVIDKLTEFIKI